MERGRPRPRPDGLGKMIRRGISKERSAGFAFRPPSNGRRGRRPPRCSRPVRWAASDAEPIWNEDVLVLDRMDGERNSGGRLRKNRTPDLPFVVPSNGRRGRRPPRCSRPVRRAASGAEPIWSGVVPAPVGWIEKELPAKGFEGIVPRICLSPSHPRAPGTTPLHMLAPGSVGGIRFGAISDKDTLARPMKHRRSPSRILCETPPKNP